MMRVLWTGTLLLLLTAQPGVAQVGHAPQSSPYRDLRYGMFLTAFSGHLGGKGGRISVGPHNGMIYGARVDLLSAKTISIGFVGTYAKAERLIVDPAGAVDTRVSGPVDQSVIFGEVALQFNLTGGKTWHALAPYVGASVGMAFSKATPEDLSGYEFGNKLFFAPQIGLRAFLTRGIALRLEAKVPFWNIKYPDAFRQEPTVDPGTLDDPHAVFPDGRLKEWVTTPVLTAGLGTAFRLPF